MVGINAACNFIGTISIGLINIGCSYLGASNWSWKIPLLFQLFNPTMACILVYLCTPESPRYLVSKGKVDEARKVIAKYHTTTEDLNGHLVNASMEKIESSLALKASKPWDFSPLYKTPADRYRLLLVFIYSMFQQWYGGALFSYYLPAVLTLVGIKDTRRQLGLNLGYATLTVVSALFGSYIFDRSRRRTLLIGAMAAFAFLLTLMTICSALFTQKKIPALGYLIIVWVYIFAIVKGTTGKLLRHKHS